jgi:hypothetical protein
MTITTCADTHQAQPATAQYVASLVHSDAGTGKPITRIVGRYESLPHAQMACRETADGHLRWSADRGWWRARTANGTYLISSPSATSAAPRPAQGGTAVAVAQPAEVAPAREPIDGHALLLEARKFLKHFAIWPSQAALDAATLWTAAAHCKDPQTGDPIWEYASRLFFTAAEYGAGKSWLAKLVASLCPSGKILLEPTKPALIDLIADHNTVVVTEVDELLATPGRNRGVVAVLNASYEPGHYHSRKQGGKAAEIHLFAPMILDGVDSLLKGTRPDMRGLISRCLVIRVKMAPDGYRRPRWDKTAQQIAARGRDRLAAWAAHQVTSGLGDILPELPGDLGSPRRCALWEPLFACALAADQGDPNGYWSTAITDAALQLESAESGDDDRETELDRIMAAWDD